MHERRLRQSAATAGSLIDSLAGPADALWPSDRWPAMRFDRPLGVGARGGHGPIRYWIEEYEPGARIRFRFTAPAGFDGFHEYEAVPLKDEGCLFRHSMVMETRWPATLTYPLVFRHLHDALIEDSLDKAADRTGTFTERPQLWNRRVRLLRLLAALFPRAARPDPLTR
ncbi:SRPBCC family protein [Actinoplanes sp. M2I2]|uniref:SRPBCC family protein n=1 Tax=Actinoplanes sp. M2I2 TaxID=1734444 RepID=UPI00202014DA|nr:SRPBCC family protein [Actinoplanes sp. M2I2]